jgi:hypothetical protein
VNANIALLNQQMITLIEQGDSSEQALDKVNQSHFAKEHNIRLNQNTEAVIELNQNKRYTALGPVLQENLASITQDRNAVAAENILAQQKQLIIAGWKTFHNSSLANLFYLVLLTLLAIFFRVFIAPSFELLYADFGYLPAITQFVLGNGGLFMLIGLWLIGTSYLIILLSLSSAVNRFQFPPRLLTMLPLFKQFKQQIDKIMLQAITEFVGRTTQHRFPPLSTWQQWYPEQDAKLLLEAHQLTALSLELNSFEATMRKQKELLTDQYIMLSTNAIKSATLLLSILLGISIAVIVFAMYTPIFNLGSII